ncbi:MAG: Antidote-toxin recognition MazE, bacterial antitoxin [Deinococcota bacterium]|jgi:bifunctional DNA-binding transcriptional regulator/antitoxin component of YhaV-PrlF toxin-antitoxin module
MSEQSVRLKLGEKGKLAIPVAIREKAGLEVGDSLAMTVLEGGIIQVSSVKKSLEGLQGKYLGGNL